MKFLCVPCDSPMTLQTVGPPEGGSLSIVYSCPECGYEMAMLTNAYETQMVQSLGVRIGPADHGCGTGDVRRPLPVHRDDSRQRRSAARSGQRTAPRPLDSRRGSQAGEGSRVRPPDGAHRHRAIRARQGCPGSRRNDPRRGARLLRHVARRYERDPVRPCTFRPGALRPGSRPDVRPAVRDFLEPHVSLQSRLRALLSRCWRHAIWSTRRTSRIAASSAPRSASKSSTKSRRSRLSA